MDTTVAIIVLILIAVGLITLISLHLRSSEEVGDELKVKGRQETSPESTVRTTRGFRSLPKRQKWFVVGVAIFLLGAIVFLGIAPYHGLLKPPAKSYTMEIVYDTGTGVQTILAEYPRFNDNGDIVIQGYWTPAPFRWKYHDEIMAIKGYRIITYTPTT